MAEKEVLKLSIEEFSRIQNYLLKTTFYLKASLY